ncbi:hypothetical protein [Halomonas sp. 18071143]|uniref:hypothetical protein n=1 Tax=Halomonas sp. 18071143 TaxID=2855441 RepID=UPI001C486EC0|nr:hypothetical protein [Halomonas sp. 18071143]
MNIEIKILKKGDEVLNVFNYLDSVAISVKRKKGHVDVVLLDKTEDGIPKIKSIWTVSEGDNEVVVSKDDVKISTF